MNQDIVVQVGADISQFSQGMANLSSQISGLGNNLNKLGQNMSNVGAGMAKSFGGATIAIGVGLGSAVKQAAEFDTQIRKAAAIAGASAKELDAMKNAALDLGASTSESAGSVAVAKHTWPVM